MELCALVDVDDAVCRGLSVPDGVIQVALDPRENDFKDGEAAAEALPGEEVALLGNLGLFGIPHFVNVLDDLEGRILGLQSLLFRLGLFAF